MIELLKSFINKLTCSLSRNASFVILQKKLKLRAKSYFFILLFIAFLVTPPLVQILKAGDDNSSVSFIEEENNTDGKFELEKKLEVISKENKENDLFKLTYQFDFGKNVKHNNE